jgi:multiple sugar transport system ATP-binding protein
MVRNPSAFLFDEPLSNLDAQLRAQMRIEIKRLHQSLRTTTVYVTHDQVEAMTMADRIVVMRDGHILQTGTPTELYENPVDVFTARFIGSPSMNLIAGRRNGAGVVFAADGDVLIGIRPHELKVGTAHEQDGVSLQGVVTAVEPLGAETLVHLDVNGSAVIATAPGKTVPQTGSTLTASSPVGSLYLFDARTEKSIGRL